MKRLSITIALCIPMCIAQAQDEDVPAFKLVQGTSKQLNQKPAKIFFTSDSGQNSYAVNAAVLSNGLALSPLSRPGIVTSEFTFAGAIAKDTVSKNPSDTRSIQAGLGSTWQLPRDASLFTTLSTDLEDDHQKNAKGHMERFDVEFVPPPKHGGKLEIGQSGGYFKWFPYAGLYQQHITSTADASKLALGYHGGPYAGIHFLASLGKVAEKATWFQRLGFDLNLMRIRDSSTSTSYAKASYNFASGTISYALYQTDTSKWKPSLAFTRTVGTDRLSSQPYKLTNYFGLQLSYGI